MRVDHLVIITFPKQGPTADLETVNGGKALYDKYQDRTDGRPLSARVIEVWDIGWRKTAPKMPVAKTGGSAPGCTLKHGTAIDQAVTGSDKVGVYMICHGHGNKPTVFGAQGSAIRLDKLTHADLAGAMTGLLVGLGLRKVRKLCLVKCGVTGVASDPLFLTAMAAALADGLDEPPMVAAWDCYVTIVPDGADGGKKKVGGGPSSSQLAKADREKSDPHKTVAVLVNGKYEVRTLAESGWSDK